MVVEYDKTVRTTMTTRRQFGHKPATTPGGAAMRARKERAVPSDYLSDALTLLQGWTRDGVQLKRVLPCDDSQHAALTERIKVASDTMRIRPAIRRLEGHTQICLDTGETDPPPDGAITDGQVTLAARIEDAYRTVVGAQ
jgi:4a-hydroxytetrahydrobiopterin dehydratase